MSGIDIINNSQIQTENKENRKRILITNIGYFGASTGAAAALVACSKLIVVILVASLVSTR